MAIGNLELPAEQLAMVREILARHVPQAMVWAFRSRVQVSVKMFSDLDQAIEDSGKLSLRTMGNLRHALSKSDLPILDMRTVRMPFMHIVERHSVAIV
jgi:hypothetical protein